VTEIEMHKMDEIKSDSAPPAAEDGRMYIESLLAKYPSTTDGEQQAILDYLTTASALDTALLTCNETVSEKLKAFRHDHRKQLGITLRSWLTLAILLSFVAVAVYLMWDFGI
tara:strand:- start:615 stop:950 length:336 start_codon:yes stop_codon:yes gene_type:complete